MAKDQGDSSPRSGSWGGSLARPSGDSNDPPEPPVRGHRRGARPPRPPRETGAARPGRGGGSAAALRRRDTARTRPLGAARREEKKATPEPRTRAGRRLRSQPIGSALRRLDRASVSSCAARHEGPVPCPRARGRGDGFLPEARAKPSTNAEAEGEGRAAQAAYRVQTLPCGRASRAEPGRSSGTFVRPLPLIVHSGETTSRAQYRALGLVSPGFRKFDIDASATLYALPIPLSNMPPHQTGTPLASQKSWIAIDCVKPPTRPGLMFTI